MIFNLVSIVLGILIAIGVVYYSGRYVGEHYPPLSLAIFVVIPLMTIWVIVCFIGGAMLWETLF